MKSKTTLVNNSTTSKRRARYTVKMLLCLVLIVAGLSIAACSSNGDENDVPNANDATTVHEQGLAIVSIGPAITEVLVDIGMGANLVMVDNFSALVAGVPAGIPTLDMMALDVESILMMEADKIFATDMILWGGDPLAIVAESGATVIYVSTSSTLAEIKDGIAYIADAAGNTAGGAALVADMAAQMDEIAAIASTITTVRTVYFEIDAPPSMFSFGEGSFLNEVIELVGAQNIFASYGAWVSVADEQVIDRNPDVILTNVFWIEDPIADISARSGWDSITAVASGNIHAIDADASSRDNHNLMTAMWEIARAVYPEYFAGGN